MKKIFFIFIVLIVVLVAGGGIFYFLRQQQPAHLDDYADYLPPDTLALVSIRDLSTLVDQFPGTALGHFLAPDTVAAMLTEMQASPEAIEEYRQAWDQVFSLLNNPGFRMVFGDDVELALLPFAPAAFDRDPEQTLHESLLVLATTASASTMKTVASNVLHGQVESIEDGGVAMTKVQVDEATTAYVLNRGNRLLIGFSPKILHRALEAKDSERRLSSTANFSAAQSFWRQSAGGAVHGRVFVQLDQVRTLLAGVQDAEVEQARQYLRGMRFIAGETVRAPQGWLFKNTSHYTYEQLDPAIKKLVDAAAEGKNTTLHLLKSNPLSYSWSSGFDARSWLQGLRQSEPEQYAKLARSFQDELGLPLEQTAAAFGPQYGFSLERIGQGGMFPLPRLLGFVQVRDRETASRFLDQVRRKINDRGIAGYHEEKVAPYTLYSWTLLPGEATQPAYALSDDLLYVANNPDDIKALFAVENERDRLSAEAMARLGNFGDQVQEANNGVFLFWPHRFAQQIKTAADWLAGMVAATKGVSVTRLEKELLALLHSTKLLVCTSDLYPDHGDAMVAFIAREEEKKGSQ